MKQKAACRKYKKKRRGLRRGRNKERRKAAWEQRGGERDCPLGSSQKDRKELPLQHKERRQTAALTA
ncbi:hypothetical protein COP2_044903 [Malus domestica]